MPPVLQRLRAAWRHRGRSGREAAMLRWNVKALGSALAMQAYAARQGGPPMPAAPVPAGIGSRACCQADIESPWLHHWCGRLGLAPLYHRKVWEDAWVVQMLWEAGMLAPGRRGLGFAVGTEALPALFAAEGAEILATDLAAEDAKAEVWRDTAQHAAGLDALYRPALLSRTAFDTRVRFRPVDMNALPPDLADGGFDFLWSVCAVEHLGSIEATLDFLLRAMRCLKPGGIAVHTTEYNLVAEGPTIEAGTTVLLQDRHLAALAARAAAAGHALLPRLAQPPPSPLDLYVDLPPYQTLAERARGTVEPPHLRMAHAGYQVTSLGLVLRAGG
ncbi:SAM-dependent methyltransferase [Dankookia sp. GCM10030260]|uniref:SAM-dependent methyltransferase n=1 Tax=Dankookia sp. GCM10030260 TaxID=3273390 RepID=UPI0036075384